MCRLQNRADLGHFIEKYRVMSSGCFASLIFQNVLSNRKSLMLPVCLLCCSDTSLADTSVCLSLCLSVCLCLCVVSVWYQCSQWDNGRARSDYKPGWHASKTWSYGSCNQSRWTTNYCRWSGQLLLYRLRLHVSLSVCVVFTLVSLCLPLSFSDCLCVSLCVSLMLNFTSSSYPKNLEWFLEQETASF